MSRTILELLLQVPGPTGDRAFCAMPRGDEQSPPFGDHLNKASSTVLNGASAAVRTDDRATLNDSSANDYDSPSRSAQGETSTAANATGSDRGDADTKESQPAEQSSATDTNTSDNATAGISTESDDDEKADETKADEISATAVVAVEAPTNKSATVSVVTAGAAIHEPVPVKIAAVALKGDQSNSGEAGEGQSAELIAADPSTENTSAATSEVAAPTATTGELVDEAAASQSKKKSRGVKGGSAKDDSLAQRNGHTGERLAGVEQNDEALSKGDAADAVKEPSKTAQSSPEPGQIVESDTSADESRDANTRSVVRQRGDTTEQTGKVATTVVANNVATLPQVGASTTDAKDDAARTGKAVASKVDGINHAVNRFQANQGDTKRVERTEGADELPRVDPARFVGRVAKALHTAQERGGTLQLRLSPPELGAMRIELMVKDGVMTASLETETASARRVLLEHLPALRERLAEQNVRIERFDVDVRREGTGGQADPRAAQDQQQPQQGQSERRQPSIPQRETAASRQAAPVAQPLTNNSGINLVA